MNASDLETWGFTEEEIQKLPPPRRELVLELLSEIRSNRRKCQGIQWLLRVIVPEKFSSPMVDGSAAGDAEGRQFRPAITISIEKAQELVRDHKRIVPRVRELLDKNGISEVSDGESNVN